jgi:hypothetical protein
MSERIKHLLAFSLSAVVTLGVMFLVVSWNFDPADIVIPFLFLVGAGVGWWARGVWERGA